MSDVQGSAVPLYTVRTVEGNEITFDEQGFLLNPDLWNPRLAETLALDDGLELKDIHWRVIDFLRNYYRENGKTPLNSELKKGTGLTLREIEAVFPKGIRLGARRLAGLPNPRSCA
jgi:dissimilatory sulfite reductase related protein